MSSDREASSFHTKRFLANSRRSGKVGDDSEDQDFIGSIRQTDMQMRASHNLGLDSFVTKEGTLRKTKGGYVAPETDSFIRASHEVNIRMTIGG
jgi:hypothetical protein